MLSDNLRFVPVYYSLAIECVLKDRKSAVVELCLIDANIASILLCD